MEFREAVSNIAWAAAFAVVGSFFMKGCFENVGVTARDVNMERVRLEQKQVELQILKERKCCDD